MLPSETRGVSHERLQQQHGAAPMLKPTCCSDAREGVNDGVVLAVGAVGTLELQTHNSASAARPQSNSRFGDIRAAFQRVYLVEEAEHGHALRVG